MRSIVPYGVVALTPILRSGGGVLHVVWCIVHLAAFIAGYSTLAMLLYLPCLLVTLPLAHAVADARPQSRLMRLSDAALGLRKDRWCSTPQLLRRRILFRRHSSDCRSHHLAGRYPCMAQEWPLQPTHTTLDRYLQHNPVASHCGRSIRSSSVFAR